MTIIDFPDMPTNGQIFTVGQKTWTYSSSEGRWNLSGGLIGPTGPTGPTGSGGATGPTGPGELVSSFLLMGA